MKTRKINLLRHLSVFLLSILIFTLGIFIGGDVEELRVQSLYTQLQEQDLAYQNVVTEGNFLDYLVSQREAGDPTISCEKLKGSYYTSLSTLEDSRIKLENYINSAKVKDEEYARLKSHYSNVQINYWILAKRISKLCDSSLHTILYFYGDEKICPECEDQGVHLSYVKEKLEDEILIFSLDSQKGGPISLLGQEYSLSSENLPLLVIDDETYSFKTNDEVFSILCENGLKNEKICS
ncbi:MAG: hypothetical protein H6500_00420 [Candidatus Woesearchaeota archaeon]|nr:hypothetical protein [Nanoarchaeota archaeon]USN44297.1 MAG: hypothetical protein H6500_00420 [Candidatus Woesearchaeota archaeon]